MKAEKFDAVKQTILHRRTIKPASMNGEKIPHDDIKELLTLADAAPTHARTEPWRFIIFSGQSFQEFCEENATIYWNNAKEDVRTEHKKATIADQYKTASHLIVVYMKRTPKAKIPESEEYAAACAAVQNILIGAESKDISAIWSTGGGFYKPEMKDYLGLGEEDKLVGFLLLGYSNLEDKLPTRSIAIEEKTIWHS